MDFQDDCRVSTLAPTPSIDCTASSYSEPVVFFQPLNNNNTRARSRKRHRIGSDGSWSAEKEDQRGYGLYVESHVKNRTDFFKAVQASGYDVMLIGALSNTQEAIKWRQTVRAETGKDIIRRTKKKKLTGRMLRSTGLTTDPPMLVEMPRRGYMIDIDTTDPIVSELAANGIDLYASPGDALDFVRRQYLPEEVQKANILMHLSGSAGKHGNGADVRAHVFLWLSQPMLPIDFQAYIDAHNRDYLHLCHQIGNGQLKGPCDLRLYQAAQPHYIADPEFLNCTDPIEERWFEFQLNGGDVHLDVQTETVGTLLERQAAARRGETTKQRRVIRRPNGEPIDLDNRKPFPREVDQCLDTLGDDKDGFHYPINAATWRQAEQDHMHGTTPERVAEFIQRVQKAVMTAERGNRSTDEIRKYADDVYRGYTGAYEQVAAKTAALQAQSHVVPALREIERLPVNQVLNDVEAEIINFIKAIRPWLSHEYRVAKEYAAGSWCTNRIPPPHLHLKGETGSGKTRAMVRGLLMGRLLEGGRVYFAVPNYKRANALAEEFGNQARELGIKRLPRITVLKGIEREGMCSADAGSVAFRRMQEAAVLSHVSASEWACAKCPLKKKGCAYHAQFREDGPASMPGVNIIVHSYLGADKIPGILHETLPDILGSKAEKDRRAYGKKKVLAFENPGSGPAPILALLIDERYDGALQKKGLVHVGRPIPKNEREAIRIADAEPHLSVMRQLCEEAASTAGKFTKNSLQRHGLIHLGEATSSFYALLRSIENQWADTEKDVAQRMAKTDGTSDVPGNEL